MKTYKTIYSFNALDEIRAGKTVYVSDKGTKSIECVNNLEVSDFAEILNAENVSTRFEFWIEEEKE